MTAYYNEFDPFAAAWLRELIKAGHIAPGEVDERSIEDVQPDDLAGFTQCHFFAGIGVWSYALRLAGWPDDRPIWTGSCPCQPFSSAGKGNGFADERHLWPAFFHLICQCNPLTVCGEQVASKDGLAWFDLVSADLEGTGYACGAIDTCAAGFGAPHIRQRLYWVAYTESGGSGTGFCDSRPSGKRGDVVTDHSPICKLGDTIRTELERHSGNGNNCKGRQKEARPITEASSSCGLVHPGCNKFGGRDGLGYSGEESQCPQGKSESPWTKRFRPLPNSPDAGSISIEWPGPVNGFWRSADWLFCRDGLWRAVVATHVALVDGPSPSMVRVCLKSTDQEKEEVANECLHPLREGIVSETFLQRSSGVSINAGSQEILRQKVHGRAYAEGNLLQPEPQQNESGIHGSGGLRDMRSDGGPSSASCGREPTKQCEVELEDVVPLLSPSLSLAELYGDRRTAEALRSLRQTIYEKGAVRDASEPVEKIWASLGEEEKNRIRLGFDASRWQKLVAFPLENNVVNRVGRLRGYGNAINASQAAEFIRAYMEIKEQPRR